MVRKVGDFLTESKIPGSDGKLAKKLSVKLWAKGVVEKNAAFEGSEHTQYYVRHAGQFMYGKLDFLNCVFGIVPDKLDGYESTLDAPAFNIHGIDPIFLLNKVMQPNFYKKNGEIANGSRKAKRIHPDTFLEMELVCPSVEEQKRIAEFITVIDARIEAQRKLVDALKSYKRGVSSQIFGRSGYMPNGYASPYPKWRETTIGEIFYERCERGRGDEELLAVTISNGVQRRSEIELKDNSSEYKENYKIVRRGDIAYNTMRMWQGACGASNYDGIVSPAYTVICPRNAENTCIDFWIYYFKEKQMLNLFQKYSQGLTSDNWNLKYTQLKDIPIVVPCVCEQRRISSLLLAIDARLQAECGKLDQMERLKKALLHKMFL